MGQEAVGRAAQVQLTACKEDRQGGAWCIWGRVVRIQHGGAQRVSVGEKCEGQTTKVSARGPQKSGR